MNKKILVIVLIAMLINLTVSFVSASSIKNRISCKTGWPVVINDIVLGPPTLADLDNDGTSEIILGSSGDFAPDSGKIYAFKCNGSLMNNFPVDLGYLVGGIPSVGDINNDEYLEIIDDAVINATAKSKIHALSCLGDSITGWPIQTNGWYGKSSLSDIDGDGYPDILIGGTHVGTNNFYLYAYNHNGGNLSGNWPTLVSCPEGMQAIGDVNNDGNLETVVGTSFYGFNGGIYVFEHNGNILPGWPVETGKRFPAPITLADLDQDGDLEIIGSADYGYFNLYVYHHNGTKMLEIQNGNGLYHEIVPADLDADGDLEVLTVTEGQVNAFHHTGETVTGWPVVFEGTPNGGGGSANGEPSVVVGDIDNDNESEILMSSMTTAKNLIYAWNSDGSLAENFPIEIVGGPFNRYCNGALALGDLDANGYTEIVFVGYQQSLYQGIHRTDIYVFELNSLYNVATMQWSQFHHDAQHTGLYVKANPNSPPNAPYITGPTSGKAGLSYAYNISSTDPDGDNVSYYVDWGDNTSSGWLGPYGSGEMVTLSHTWSQKGTYTIRAKTKDIYDEESDWTTLPVTMPLDLQISQSQKLITLLRFALTNKIPILTVILQNIQTTTIGSGVTKSSDASPVVKSDSNETSTTTKIIDTQIISDTKSTDTISDAEKPSINSDSKHPSINQNTENNKITITAK